MPIVESNSGNGFKGAISYSMQLEKLAELDQEELPVFIECNGVYGSYAAMAHQMRWVAETQDYKRPVLHFRVNFSPSESAHLPKEIQVAAVKSILRGLGIDENRQYIISQHNDKEHTHYHIIANKVDLDGEKMDLTNFNYRATAQADRVEQEMKLELTPNRTIFYSADNATGFRYATAEEKAAMHLGGKLRPDRREGVQEVKEYLSATIQSVLLDERIVSSDTFEKALNNRGIEVRFMKNVDGISGVSFNKEGISVRGTHLGLRWGKIAKSLDANQKLQDAFMEKRAHLRFSVLEEVKKVVGLQLSKSDDITSFSANLLAHGIDYEEGKGLRYECKEGNEQSLLGSHILFRLADMGLSDEAIKDQLADNLEKTRLDAQRKANELARVEKQERFNRAVETWKKSAGLNERILKAVNSGKDVAGILKQLDFGYSSYKVDADTNGKLDLIWTNTLNNDSNRNLVVRFDLRDLGMELVFNQSYYDQLNKVSLEMYNKNLQNQLDMYGSVHRLLDKVINTMGDSYRNFMKQFKEDKNSAAPVPTGTLSVSKLFQNAGFKVNEEEDKVSRDLWTHTGKLSVYQNVLNELMESLRRFFDRLKDWAELQNKPEKKAPLLSSKEKKNQIALDNLMLQQEKRDYPIPKISELENMIKNIMKKMDQPMEPFMSVSDYEKWKFDQAVGKSSVKVDAKLYNAVSREIKRVVEEEKQIKRMEQKNGRSGGMKMN